MDKFIIYIRRGLRYIFYGIPNKHVIASISFLSPNKRLEGKSIIITGGGRGIGYYIAKKCVEEGAKVLIAGRNEEVLKRSSAEIGCKYLRLDVQDVDSFHDFYKKAECLIGKVNCLVNNAGISLHEESIFAVSQQQFEDQLNTNFRGPFFLTKLFMERNGNMPDCIKKILFISSETGMTVDERPYGLTKAAINSLVQGLAHKYVNQGYRINAIAPGVTISDMVGKKNDGNLAGGGGITGRYYLPEEIAEIACFFLCDASNCLNGQILVCNEGKTINARWK